MFLYRKNQNKLKTFRSYLTLLILFAVVNQINAQNKAGLSLSIPEGLGLFYGHEFPNDIALEVKASGTPWFKRTNDSWNGGESVIKTNLFYSGIFLKKYISGTKQYQGIYYGGYVRYFINHWWRQDFELLNIEQQTAIEEMYKQGSKTTRSETTHKISAGGLAGYSKKMNQIFSLDLALGIGFAPPPFYWINRKYYFQSPDRVKAGPDWLTGYLNHAGAIARIDLNINLAGLFPNNS
jgi:hypothetical protein